jgi:prevent-host-death family protein
MKVVSITHLHHEVLKLVEHAQQTHEPVLVCVQSTPVAYIVDAETYEEMRREVVRLRHDLFWQGAAKAEAEQRGGSGKSYTDVEALIADLGLPK